MNSPRAEQLARLVWRTRLRTSRCDGPGELLRAGIVIEPRTWFVRTAVLAAGGVFFVGVGVAIALGIVMAWMRGEAETGSSTPTAWDIVGLAFGGLVLLGLFPTIGVWILSELISERRRSEVVVIRDGLVRHFVRGVRGWRCVVVPLEEVRYTTIGPIQGLWRNGKLMDQTGVVIRTTKGRIHVGMMHQGRDAWALLDRLRAFESELRLCRRVRHLRRDDGGPENPCSPEEVAVNTLGLRR